MPKRRRVDPTATVSPTNVDEVQDSAVVGKHGYKTSLAPISFGNVAPWPASTSDLVAWLLLISSRVTCPTALHHLSVIEYLHRRAGLPFLSSDAEKHLLNAAIRRFYPQTNGASRPPARTPTASELVVAATGDYFGTNVKGHALARQATPNTRARARARQI
jgi:hypothetical protein